MVPPTYPHYTPQTGPQRQPVHAHSDGMCSWYRSSVVVNLINNTRTQLKTKILQHHWDIIYTPTACVCVCVCVCVCRHSSGFITNVLTPWTHRLYKHGGMVMFRLITVFVRSTPWRMFVFSSYLERFLLDFLTQLRLSLYLLCIHTFNTFTGGWG